MDQKYLLVTFLIKFFYCFSVSFCKILGENEIFFYTKMLFLVKQALTTQVLVYPIIPQLKNTLSYTYKCHETISYWSGVMYLVMV